MRPAPLAPVGQNGGRDAGLLEAALHGGGEGGADVADELGMLEERAAIGVGVVERDVVFAQHAGDEGEKRREVGVHIGCTV